MRHRTHTPEHLLLSKSQRYRTHRDFSTVNEKDTEKMTPAGTIGTAGTRRTVLQQVRPTFIKQEHRDEIDTS